MFAANRSGVQKKGRQIFAANRSGVQKKGRKLCPVACLVGNGACFNKGRATNMNENDIKQGYVYHIKNSYFDLAKDDKLMRNHEGGAYRPTYYCLKDEKTGLLWVIPMSSRVEKYTVHMQKDIERYGKCLKILVARYGDGESAFLFQNMFPILPKYINHIHTVAGSPMQVNPAVQKIITSRFKEVLRLYRRGIKMVFPDIIRLEKLMLEES